MENTAPYASYRKITPADVYTNVTVAENKNASSGCEFMDQFAALVRRFGKRSLSKYAGWLDVRPAHLDGAVRALTGMSALAWSDEFTRLAARDYLLGTRLQVQEVARRLGFTSATTFDQFLRRVERRSAGAVRWHLAK